MMQETENEQLLRISRDALAGIRGYSAQELYGILLKNEDARDYYIISLQNRESYAEGHIPGAIWWDVDLADPSSALDSLPKDKQIIVTCDNGQRSNQIALFLRQLGYDAHALMFGLVGWNQSYAGSGAYRGDSGYPVTSEEAALDTTLQFSSPVSSVEDEALILQRTAQYAHQGRNTDISPDELLNTQENVLIISMQRPQDYTYSHIAGSVNISANDFLNGSESLLSLPRDRKIVVTCYIGHYSNIGALLLNQLGYEAYSLEWGLAGWNLKGFRVPLPILEISADFPIEN